MFEWFREWVYQNPSTVLTCIRGLSAESLMERYEPIGPMTGRTVAEAQAAENPSVLVAELDDGWLVAIERRSVVGSDTAWLASLSEHGESVSLAFTEGSVVFLRALDGRLTAGVDLVLPETLYGDDPEWLGAYLTEVDGLPGGPDDPTSAALLLEMACGIHLEERMLSKLLPCREVRDPYAA